MKQRLFYLVLGLLAGGIFMASPAYCNPLDLYGFGARANGMGGAFTAVADDWSAIYYNPGGLSQIKGYDVSVGFMFAKPYLSMELEPSMDVSRTEAKDLYRLAEEQEDVSRINGYTIGAAMKFHPMFTFGMGIYLPAGLIIRFKPLDSGKPTFLMHENRAKRVVVLAGIAAEPLPGLSIGVGASIFLRVMGSASIPLLLDDNNLSLDPSTPPAEPVDADMDVNLRLPMTTDPMGGIHYQPCEWLRIGASYRYSYKLLIDIKAAADVEVRNFTLDLSELSKLIPDLFPMKVDVIIDIPMLGDTPLVIPLELEGLEGELTLTAKLPVEASLFTTELWKPQQAAFGVAAEPVEGLVFSADATWYDWSEFPSPDVELDIDEISIDISTLPTTITGRVKSVTIPVIGAIGPIPPVDISIPGIDAQITLPLYIADPTVPKMHDIVVPRFGVEYRMPKLRGLWMVNDMQLAVRTGYQYMPTPLEEEKGSVNLADNDTHVISAGMGATFMDFFTIDGYGQLFYLEPRRVTKDVVSDVYQFTAMETEGQIYVGGVQVGIKF